MREYVGHTVWQRTRYIFFKKRLYKQTSDKTKTTLDLKLFVLKLPIFKICLLSFFPNVLLKNWKRGGGGGVCAELRFQSVPSPRPSLDSLCIGDFHMCDFSTVRGCTIWRKSIITLTTEELKTVG